MTEAETTIPLYTEQLNVEKRQVQTGTVRVQTRTELVEQLVNAELASTAIEVIRIPVDREVDLAPEIRTEGDVTIVPVMEEILVVEKRLVLKEEIHIKRLHTTEPAEISVSLRKQKAVISRDREVEQEHREEQNDD